MWNAWRFDLADQLLAPEMTFRGSLGDMLVGPEAFRGYMAKVRSAFPDFHNQIEELIAEDDRVVARLTYSGTHTGELWGIVPTGRRISYACVALFQVVDRRFTRAWVLGDTAGLRAQLVG